MKGGNLSLQDVLRENFMDGKYVKIRAQRKGVESIV